MIKNYFTEPFLTTNPKVAFMSSALNKDDYLNWFYNEFINVYLINEKNEIRYYAPDYFCPYLQEDIVIPYSYVPQKFKNDISSYIMQLLENKSYIYMQLNNFYFPNSINNQKYFLHSKYFYGYDREKCEFYIGHFINNKFTKDIVQFENVNHSFQSLNTKDISRYKISRLVVKEAGTYNTDFLIIKKNIKDFLNSTATYYGHYMKKNYLRRS